jgi:hypothetical protein
VRGLVSAPRRIERSPLPTTLAAAAPDCALWWRL